MGLYDRDYVRELTPSGWGFEGAPGVKCLIAVNIVVFLLQVFVARPPQMSQREIAAQWADDEEHPPTEEDLYERMRALHPVSSGAMTGGLIVAGLLLLAVADYLWSRVTGREDVLQDLAMRWKLALLPGVLAQVWYAAYAAHQVQLDSWDDSLGRLVLVHTVAVLGLVIGVVLFDLAFRGWLDLYKRVYVPLAVAALSIASYAAFFALPGAAETLSAYWLNVLWVFALFA